MSDMPYVLLYVRPPSASPDIILFSNLPFDVVPRVLFLCVSFETSIACKFPKNAKASCFDFKFAEITAFWMSIRKCGGRAPSKSYLEGAGCKFATRLKYRN